MAELSLSKLHNNSWKKLIQEVYIPYYVFLEMSLIKICMFTIYITATTQANIHAYYVRFHSNSKARAFPLCSFFNIITGTLLLIIITTRAWLYLAYSRKYWWELNLVVGSQIAIINVLVDLNLAVRYGIAIRIYASKKFWRILIWQLLKQTTKPTNLTPAKFSSIYLDLNGVYRYTYQSYRLCM